jgi:hypothetical protein
MWPFARCSAVVRAVAAPVAADLQAELSSPSAVRKVPCRLSPRSAPDSLLGAANAVISMLTWGMDGCPSSFCMLQALLARGWDLAWVDGVTAEVQKRRLQAPISQIEAVVRCLAAAVAEYVRLSAWRRHHAHLKRASAAVATSHRLFFP